MTDDGRLTGSRASTEPVSRLGPSGFDPERELLVQRVIIAIATASVPHECPIPGALDSRSLSYYLGAGIDHFRHNYNRHETLLRKAAEQAITAIAVADVSAALMRKCSRQ